MSDSDNSIHQDDSDVDIYKDLTEYNFEEELYKAEVTKETYKKEAAELGEKVKKLTEDNEKLSKLNTVLEKNLSALLKTAQAEVKRKDSLIQELRVQIDSFAFRRKNKLTTDKCTNTDETDSLINCKNVNKNFKCAESKELLLSKNKNRSNDEHISLKKEDKKVDNKIHEVNQDCDNKEKSIYNTCSYLSSRERNELSYDAHNEYHLRDHTRYKVNDGRRRLRRSDDYHHSRRRSRFRDRTPVRKRRKSPRIRKRSSSPFRSRSRSCHDSNYERGRSKSTKEDSLERRVSASKVEGAVCKNKGDANIFRRVDLKSNTNAQEQEDIKSNKQPKKQKSQVTSRTKNHLAEISKESTLLFETKSPLDTLYGEMTEKNSKLHSKTMRGTHLSTKSEKNEDELGKEGCDADNHSSLQRSQEDWKLSFVNERQADTKAMTLYSRRMMQKFLRNSENSSDNVKMNVHDVSEPEKRTNVNANEIESEKESGELTDDESLVENSKEYQEVTKAALLENKTNDMLPKNLKERDCRDENDSAIKKHIGTDVPDKEPIVLNEKKIHELSDEHVEYVNKPETFADLKDVREVIEFSPFKNNYKLIAISPMKPIENLPEPGLSLDENKKMLEKCEVENKSFEVSECIDNKSLHLKRHDLDLGNSINNNVVKKNTESISRDSELEFNHSKKEPCLKDENVLNKVEKVKKKQKKMKSEVTSGPGTIPENNEDDKKSEVGETTQFLDYFLATTSPSQPILPAERNIAANESESKESSNISLRSDFETKLNKLPASKLKKRKVISSSDISPIETKGDKFESGSSNRKKKTESEKLVKESETKTNPSNRISHDKMEKVDDNGLRRVGKRKMASRKESEEKSKTKRGSSENNTSDSLEIKKPKLDNSDQTENTRLNPNESSKDPKEKSVDSEETKEDISFFEFFKPITKKSTNESSEKKTENKEDCSQASDFKLSFSYGSLQLETPNKQLEKPRNSMANERALFTESNKNNSFSPLIGIKSVEMTPKRLLKNDLMLTDSEDGSAVKNPSQNRTVEDIEQFEDDMSESDNSECESDSGASDFVDLL